MSSSEVSHAPPLTANGEGKKKNGSVVRKCTKIMVGECGEGRT